MKINTKWILSIALIILILFGGTSAYLLRAGTIFSPVKTAEDPGFCLMNPDDSACDGIDCSTSEGQENPLCFTNAIAGVNDLKNELTGSGIDHTDTAGALIVKYINYLLPYLALGTFLAFVVAGFMYVTAFGQEDQLEKAKKILIWAVVGILLVIASYTLVEFLTSDLVSELGKGSQN